MKKLILSVAALLFCAAVQAEVAVVVGKSSAIGNISKDDLERLYLGKSTSIGDTKVKLFNQDANSEITAEFNRLALNKSSSQVKAFWSKLMFTGKGNPPDEVDSNSAVIKAVSSDATAVGYIDAGSVTGDVKVILTLQ